MDQRTPRPTLLSPNLDPGATPDRLARRGWFAAATALGAAFLTKLVSPDRAEAVNPSLLLNQGNLTTGDTTLTGTLGVFGVAGATYDSIAALRAFVAPGSANQIAFLAEGANSLGGDGSGSVGIAAFGGNATGRGNPGIGVSGSGGAGGVAGEGGIGVEGFTNSATNPGVSGSNNGAGAGVRGQNTSGTGVGVLGISSASHGLFAASAAATGFGGLGQNIGAGIGMGGISQNGIGVFGQNGDGANWAGAFLAPNQNAPGLFVQGAFVVQGAKSGAVETAHHGTRLLYAVESPESWFEDFGTARLEAGQAVVPLESIFRETVSAEHRYRVFLTPRGDCQGLYVAAQDDHGFEVRELRGGRSSVEFDYRVVVKARGHEARRLERIEPPVRPVIPDVPRVEASPLPDRKGRTGRYQPAAPAS